MSNIGSYQRKLDKKANNTIRDNENGLGNARGVVKANRALGKAIIDAAIEEQDGYGSSDDEQVANDLCVICEKPCMTGITCSTECFDEAVKLGFAKRE